MTSLPLPSTSAAVRKPAVLCIGAWILTMIALPIARWIWGEPVIPFIATVSAIFQSAAVFVILREAWGIRASAVTAAVVALLTWGVEFLGSATGFPFGAYSYSDLLQPQVLGVPLLIPMAWLMMLAPSWAVAFAILGDRADTGRERFVFALTAAAAMTAWDLYLDPQMTGWGFWVWSHPGTYFGIPLLNFVGWFVVAALVTLIVRPRRVPLAPLLLIYGVVWAFQAIGSALFWGQPGPALFGFTGMGVLLGMAVVNARRVLWTR